MSLAAKIKSLRKSRGLTQSELGELIGVQKATIQKYENEIIVNLKQETITKLCEVFNVTPAYLLDWDEKYNSDQLKKEVKMLEAIQLLYNIDNEGLRKIWNYINYIKDDDDYKITSNKNND